MTQPAHDNDNNYDDDDIYIMMKCLSVCHEKRLLPPGSLLKPPVTTYNHPAQPQVSFHGFSQFQIGFHVFMSVLTVLKVPGWFFMVPGGF